MGKITTKGALLRAVEKSENGRMDCTELLKKCEPYQVQLACMGGDLKYVGDEIVITQQGIDLLKGA